MLAEKVDPIPVSQPGLMAFEESANVVKNDNFHSAKVERFISNPFPVDIPKELLERSFPVATISWTNTMALQTINFPGAFLSITSITDVLKKFTWLRAGVHIEIKMQSTPYHQGSLLVGWLPCAGTGEPQTIQQISGYNATVLSASTQDSCSYDIPYLSPIDWITSSISTTSNSDIARLYIKALNPLLTSSSSVSAVVPLLVFASFKDIEVTGYQSQMKPGPKFQKNSEAASKKDGEDTKSAVSSVSKVLRKIPVVGEVYSPIADLLNSFAGDLSKPTSETPPCTNIHPYYSDVNHGAGMTQATQLSLYPNPQLAQAPLMFGMETSHMTVSHIARQPILYDQTMFNGTVVNWEVAVSPFVLGATLPERDYLASIAKANRFWRGSIKYLIHFCMPAFYSCRVRLSVDFMGGGTPSNFGDLMTRFVDVKGDTWEEVTVPFMNRLTWADDNLNPTFVPFFRIFQLTAIVGSTAPATPVMYINIFRSGGEDIQFAGPRPLDGIITAERAKIGYSNQYSNQMNIGKRFQSQFPCINKGSMQSVEKGQCMTETTGTVSDILKRQQQCTINPKFPGNTGNALGLFDYYANFFVFWRGGRILRHIHFENTTLKSGWYLDITNNSTRNMSCGWAPAYSSPVGPYQPEAIHVPYLSGQPYYPVQIGTDFTATGCQVSQPIDAYLGVTTDTGNMTTIAGADDLVLLYLVPWGNLTSSSFTKTGTSSSITTAKTSSAQT